MTAALARRDDELVASPPAPDRPKATPHHPPSAVELAVRGLCVGYETGQPPVFRDVSFAVERGASVALVGPNGAGKSTLLRCCLGFVRPLSGDADLFGERIAALGPADLRRLRAKVGFVAQKHNLVPRLSVLSNVVHGCLAARPGPRQWLQGLASADLRARALQALQRVGLEDLALRRADRLSGGQSQRVAIARALVSEPRLVMADEPAASLDCAAGEEVMAAFAAIARDSGATFVFTTHRLEHALAYADRVIGLRDGRLALDARAADVGLDELRGLFG